MGSTFFGLEIAKRGLLAQMTALNTVSHNIVNANTQGYTKQRVDLTATLPFSAPSYNRDMVVPGQLGTGVQVGIINSMRNNILDARIKEAMSTQSSSSTLTDKLSELESFFNEPNTPNLGDSLNEFWNALSDVANNPESTAIRSNLLNVTQTITGHFHYLGDRIAKIENDLNTAVSTSVKSINNLADELANVNQQIFSSLNIGDQPNDLMDKRDLLLNDLAKITNYQATPMDNGMIKVEINGHTLVGGNWTMKLSAQPDIANNNFLKPVFVDDGVDALISGGSLKGDMDMRDVYLPGYKADINAAANALITNMNAMQQGGYALNAAAPTGIDFFTGTDMNDININPVLDGNPALVAAAKNASSVGDGSNAVAMSGLKDALVMAGGTLTINQYYANIVSNIGSDSAQAKNDTGIYDTLNTQLSQLKNSASGVSLDEEMTDMIKYQHAFTANTKVVQVQDQVLQTILDLIK